MHVKQFAPRPCSQAPPALLDAEVLIKTALRSITIRMLKPMTSSGIRDRSWYNRGSGRRQVSSPQGSPVRYMRYEALSDM